MEKIIISVEKSTRMVSLTKTTIGNDLENLQQELVFKFTDNFVNGSARLEYKIGNEKYHIPMTKEGESYTIPIKNVITKEGKIEMQLVIVEAEQNEEIPVFKSNVFYVYCNKSINAQTEAPDDYEYWLDVIQTKLAEIDEALEEVDEAITETNNLNLDVSDKVDGNVTVTLTKKDGTKKIISILDGVSLEFMWQGTSLGIKTDNMSEYVFVDLQGIQGPTGPQGEAFRIKKTYPSVQAMNADFNNMHFGDYVMIASTTEEEDNAKLYTKGEEQWIFIADFSGAIGIKGETGATPVIHIGTVTSGNQPSVSVSGTAEDPVLNFVLPKGDKPVKGVDYFTQSDIDSMVSEITEDATSTFNQNVSQKTEEFNTNASNKTSEFNSNAELKTIEFNENADSIEKELDYYKTIYNVLPKVKGNGTDITLDNTSDTVLKLGLSGNTEQETTTGKNLLQVNSATRTLSNNYYQDIATGILIEQNMVGTFLSFSFNINISSLTTTSSDIRATLGYGNTSGTMSNSIKHFTYSTVAAGEYEGKIENCEITNDMVGKYIVLRYISLRTQSSATYTYSNAQLEFNKTSTDYEPYTGGIPAPNPEFPMDIHTISGGNEIKVENKNLWDEQWENGYWNRTTGTKGSGNNYLRCVDYIPINPNTTIYFTKPSEYANYAVIFYNSSKEILNAIVPMETASKTFTAPINAYYFTFYVAQNSGTAIYNNNIMINKGSTALPYTPHQEQNYELNLGNMCKEFIQGYVDIDGTINSGTGWTTTKDYIVVEPNTSYTFKANSPSTRCLIGEYDANKIFISPRQEIVLGNTYTTTSNCKYIKFSIYDGSTNIEMYKTGTTPLEYCKIDDYSDEFFKNDPENPNYDSTLELDKWYLKKNVGKVVFNGSENWLTHASNDWGSICYLNYPGVLKNVPILSNYFTYDKSLPDMTSSSAIGKISNNKYADNYLYIGSISANNAELKTWLSTHNTEVYYPLLNPTNTEITDTNLISQLNAIKYALAYENQTNISQINNELPFIIDAETLRDMGGEE